ncbi:MAG: RDD family protein [Chloroflexota bacterium]|nr:RDD family protein [Chloroflexota bacterium]
MGQNDPTTQPPPQGSAGPPPPPPAQGWQSRPQQPGPPPPTAGQPAGGSAWTSNLTASGTIPGPGGIALADVPSRIIAIIIDFIIVGIASAIAAGVVGLVVGGLFTERRVVLGVTVEQTTLFGLLIGGLLGTILALIISAAYFIYTWTRMNGATLGMQLLKLRVADSSNGGQISQQQAINRWLLLGAPQGLSWLLGAIPVIGLIAPFAILGWYIYLLVTTAQSPTRQGFHDTYAKTVVAKTG